MSLQIFKPGTHTAMSGASLAFSEADLLATANAYDTKKHEAPLVVGHPAHDLPAYGWVKSLSFSQGGLEAEPQQVNPEFADMVNNGSFKNMSASFYAPDSPSNPVPGVYYLRHVGFLGAQPPAIKGLRSPSFAASEEGVIEFSEWGDRQQARLFRRLRDWMIGKFGLEEADQVLSDWDVSSIAEEAQREHMTDIPSTAYAETKPPPQEKPMDEATKARLEQLQAENAELKKKDANQAAELRQAQFSEFIDKEVREGRLLPAQKSDLLCFMESLHGSQPLQFSEGQAKSPIDWLKGFIGTLPKRVEFAELAGGSRAEAGEPATIAPGFTVNKEKQELHEKALAYAEQHNVDYIVAIKRVGG